jgi:hypothetical protein
MMPIKAVLLPVFILNRFFQYVMVRLRCFFNRLADDVNIVIFFVVSPQRLTGGPQRLSDTVMLALETSPCE